MSRIRFPDYSREMAFVLNRVPGAYEHDDGESVKIYKPQEVDEPCSECKRPWKRIERRLLGHLCLGSGGHPSYAWISAAHGLGYEDKTKAFA